MAATPPPPPIPQDRTGRGAQLLRAAMEPPRRRSGLLALLFGIPRKDRSRASWTLLDDETEERIRTLPAPTGNPGTK